MKKISMDDAQKKAQELIQGGDRDGLAVLNAHELLSPDALSEIRSKWPDFPSSSEVTKHQYSRQKVERYVDMISVERSDKPRGGDGEFASGYSGDGLPRK